MNWILGIKKHIYFYSEKAFPKTYHFEVASNL